MDYSRIRGIPVLPTCRSHAVAPVRFLEIHVERFVEWTDLLDRLAAAEQARSEEMLHRVRCLVILDELAAVGGRIQRQQTEEPRHDHSQIWEAKAGVL